LLLCANTHRVEGPFFGDIIAMDAASTQLAERFPQIDLPQRVDPPPYMNAPPRSVVMSKDQLIRESSFSPKAHSRRKYDIASYKVGGPEKATSGAAPRKGGGATLKSHTENQSPLQAQVKDYTMLAFSSRRAGRHQMEGAAYFSMGVLYDNMGQYMKALDCYKKFVAVCQKLNDLSGEALAYNCIGTNYQHMSTEDSGMPYDGGFSDGDSRNLKSSLHYHNKHLEIADDAGKFVAHSNLGLCLGSLGQHIEAAKHHQEALRLAIRLQSTHGQSIAVGNLGLLGSRQGDLVTAKACMDQHLQLVQSLHDLSAEANAWMQLGLLANKEGNFEQAARYFEQARRIALRTGEQGTLKRANCNIGIAQGNLKLSQHMSMLAQNAADNALQ